VHQVGFYHTDLTKQLVQEWSVVLTSPRDTFSGADILQN